VRTDDPLKALFQTRPQDLLPLVGDAGVQVLSVGSVELPGLKRTADLVLRLRRGRDVYLRHIEFQSRYRGNIGLRCFEYATRLAVDSRLAVLTTVIYLHPPAPQELVFRESVGAEVIHERRFSVLRLWEMEAREALSLGPGGAALVPLLRGSDLGLIAEASQAIRSRADDARARDDLLAILRVFSEGRYTPKELVGLIPDEVVMASTLFERLGRKVWAQARAQALVEGRAEGLAAGRAEGRAEGLEKGREEGREKGREEGGIGALREVCHDAAALHHPKVAHRVARVIAACSRPSTLRRWTLRAALTTDEEFEALLRGPSLRKPTRGRASRPARAESRLRRA
jgi:predicted transposase YdaD